MNNEACYRGGLTPLTIGVQTIYFWGETGHTTQIFNPKIANFYANHRQNLKNALKRQKFLNLQARNVFLGSDMVPSSSGVHRGASVASPPWGSQGGRRPPPGVSPPPGHPRGGASPTAELAQGGAKYLMTNI